MLPLSCLEEGEHVNVKRLKAVGNFCRDTKHQNVPFRRGPPHLGIEMHFAGVQAQNGLVSLTVRQQALSKSVNYLTHEWYVQPTRFLPPQLHVAWQLRRHSVVALYGAHVLIHHDDVWEVLLNMFVVADQSDVGISSTCVALQDLPMDT